MAAQYKTRCPHCQAQFRISEEHLKQAKGQVRCGSCLQVFLATENLVDEPAPQPAARPAARAPAPQPKKPARPAQQAQPAAAPPEKWSLPPETPASKAPASRWTLDDSEVPEDFREDEPATPKTENNDTRVSLGSLELSDSFLSLDGDDDEKLRDEDFSDMAGAARGGQSESSDEAWAEKLLEELSDEDQEPAPPVSAGSMKLTETEKEAKARQEREQKKVRKQQKKTEADEAPAWAEDADTDIFAEDTGFGLLDEQDDDIAAIELPAAERKSVAPRIQVPSLVADTGELLRWGALSALLLIVLAVQYLMFNFDTLARTPEWRGFYATVCNAFPCTLPDPSNLAAIQGANLVVREHPEFGGGLVVDVLLFNKAAYEQPFPDLELGFTDLKGTPVAGRRFQPQEYLRGDLEGASLMPVDTPVHVSLEILDPGSSAVNYTLRFLPAASGTAAG